MVIDQVLKGLVAILTEWWHLMGRERRKGNEVLSSGRGLSAVALSSTSTHQSPWLVSRDEKSQDPKKSASRHYDGEAWPSERSILNTEGKDCWY